MFVVYPAAIARMPGSPVWAALFFVFLFTVGVDSQVSNTRTVHVTVCHVNVQTLTVGTFRCGISCPLINVCETSDTCLSAGP